MQIHFVLSQTEIRSAIDEAKQIPKHSYVLPDITSFLNYVFK